MLIFRQKFHLTCVRRNGLMFRMNVGSSRIEGWKAIATYFRRDRTTVMRWAQSRGLPVHRMPGGGSSSVFAYAHELDQWMANAAPEEPAGDALEAQTESDVVPVTEPDMAEEANAHPAHTPADTTLKIVRASRMPWMLAGAAAIGLVAVAAITLPGRSTSGLRPGHPVAAVTTTAAKADSFPADPAIAAIYVQARDDWALRTADGLHRAVAGFGQVVSRDPQFAPGYAGLADAYLLIREFDAMPDAQAYAQAEAAAKASLAINPDLPDPHRALGFIHYWWHHDHKAARASFTRALALDPKNAQTHFWYGNCLMDNGEVAAGLKHLNTARLFNPDSAAIKTDYAWALWLSGQRAEGKALLLAQQTAQPSSVGPHTYLSYIYMIEGNWQAYLRESGLRADKRDDPAMEARQQLLQSTFATGGAPALIKALASEAAADRAAGLSESSIVLANWAGATGAREVLLTILKDSDARQQSWSMGGFADLAVTKLPNDSVVAGLVARRRGESLVAG
jgi:tetratricopeptide (TPR) repeat protein